MATKLENLVHDICPGNMSVCKIAVIVLSPNFEENIQYELGKYSDVTHFVERYMDEISWFKSEFYRV